MSPFLPAAKQRRSMDHDSLPSSESQLANVVTQEEEGPENFEYRGHIAKRHGQATSRSRHLVGYIRNLPLAHHLSPQWVHMVEASHRYTSALPQVQWIPKGSKY